jgi:hypothetical protein
MTNRTAKILFLVVLVTCTVASVLPAQPSSEVPTAEDFLATDCETACCAACTQCANNDKYCNFCFTNCNTE